MTRVLRVQPSEAQVKLPESRRRARYLWLPPRVRTVWMRLAPIRVFAGWRPASKALFFPVRSCQKFRFISMCVEQAQNAWGRFLQVVCLPACPPFTLSFLKRRANGRRAGRQTIAKTFQADLRVAPHVEGLMYGIVYASREREEVKTYGSSWRAKPKS